MKAITVRELIVVLRKIDKNLPCYVYLEGGEDVLFNFEVEVKLPEIDFMNRNLPKRLLIG